MPEISFALTGDLTGYSRAMREAISIAEDANAEIERLEKELSARRAERAQLDAQLNAAGTSKITYQQALAAQTRIELIDKETRALERSYQQQISLAANANSRITAEAEKAHAKQTAGADKAVKQQLADRARAEAAGARQAGRFETGGFRGAIRAGLQGTGLPLPFVTGGPAAIVGGLAGAAAALAIRKSIGDTLEWADAISHLSRVSDAGAKDVSILALASEKYGVDVGTLTQAIQTLNERVLRSPERFRALGISLTDAQGRARSSVEIFEDVRRVLGNTQEGAAKLALEEELLGSSTDAMNTLVNASPEAFDKMKQAVSDSARVIDEQGIRSAREYQAMLRDLGSTAGDLAQTLGSIVVPAILKFTDIMREGFDALGRSIHDTSEEAISAEDAFREAAGRTPSRISRAVTEARAAEQRRQEQRTAQAAAEIKRSTGENRDALFQTARQTDALTDAFEHFGLSGTASVGSVTSAVKGLGDAIARAGTRPALDLAKTLGFDEATLRSLFVGLEDVVGQSADRIQQIFRERGLAKLREAFYDVVVKPTEDAFNKADDRIEAIDERLQRLGEKGAVGGRGGLSAGELAHQSALMAEREAAVGARRVEIERELAELRAKATAAGGALTAAEVREREKLLAERAELVQKRDLLKVELERLRVLNERNQAELDAALALKARAEALGAARAAGITEFEYGGTPTVSTVKSTIDVKVDVTSSDGSLVGVNIDFVQRIAERTFEKIAREAEPLIRRGSKAGLK